MTHNNLNTKAMELALKVAGHEFPRLSQLGACSSHSAKSYHLCHKSDDIVEYAFFLLDVTCTEEGKIHLIEANGSNAALSSIVTGRDDDRAQHMACAFQQKPRPSGPVVITLCHQKGFIHIPEFYSRAGRFSELIFSQGQVCLRGPDENLNKEDISVVCGPIDEVAPYVEQHGSHLFYRGRRVVFATNPNLLPELVRLGKVGRKGSGYDIDDSFFHEGNGTPLVHDKALQQNLTEGTEITPLKWREAYDRDGWLEAVRWFREQGLICVAKMNSGSGGAGIKIVTPDMSDTDCKLVLEGLMADASKKYGARSNSTVFPVRLFEFAKARPYPLNGRGHLWDLRLQCLLLPGQVEIRPCVIRLCPEPFDGSYSWESCVSNLTGRDPNKAMSFMRYPNAKVLAALGMDEDALNRAMKGCAEWCAAASRWAATRSP